MFILFEKRTVVDSSQEAEGVNDDDSSINEAIIFSTREHQFVQGVPLS